MFTCDVWETALAVKEERTPLFICFIYEAVKTFAAHNFVGVCLQTQTRIHKT